MKYIKLFILSIAAFFTTNCTTIKVNSEITKNSREQNREYYQLKVYSLNSEEQVIVMDTYLKQAYLPALKRLNLSKIGVFKQLKKETDTIKKIFVLIPFKTFEQFLEIENGLRNDKAYLNVASKYLNASYDQPPYLRIESTLMKAFVDFPKMKLPNLNAPKADRVYELRSYESATDTYYQNKVDMFNAGGEIKLFDRLNFNSVFYGEVISGAKMPNLMYLTTFSDMTSRDKHWEQFGNSPEWKELTAIEKYKNTVSHADIMLLYPTEYSDY
ncbi:MULTISPECIES: NIPSNAP family protein [Flavobacteriaceae]|jgi:hypothetical protein|uniref:NIPSNAP protein n=1 Tax=Maribacter ulvicola TaxID=228959 RepID=A0A1N6QDD8_9FLAO|nr:NIPSNAP family protein [Maribacter ulvicola]SIQ14525.1 NIPSNAP protein [Maribacter ulvicola]